jgi:hypothetical protein
LIRVSNEDGKQSCYPKELNLGFLGGNTTVFFAYLAFASVRSEFIVTMIKSLKTQLKNVYYLSSERGAIQWVYETPTQEHNWVGRKGQYTLEILAKLMKPEHDEKRLPYELFFESFGIRRAWAGWEKLHTLTSDYEDLFLRSSLRFPSLGYGSKQLLPIITQLAYCNTGSIVLVEEPEISLHPSYQQLLPALFGQAINEGKQVLVTTHSSYFPLSLERVLKGFDLKGQTTRGRRKYQIRLSPKDIAIYHVERNKKGFTGARKLKIDENGLAEGIPSFIEVERELLNRFTSRD